VAQPIQIKKSKNVYIKFIISVLTNFLKNQSITTNIKLQI